MCTSSKQIFVLDSYKREGFVGFRRSLLDPLTEHATRVTLNKLEIS